MNRFVTASWLWAVVWMAGGCAPQVGGRFSLTSQSPDGPVLAGEFDTAVYALDGGDRVAVLLLEGTAERPVRAVMIRMFWRPRAGRTPIEPTATNAMIHYAIFTGSGSDRAGEQSQGQVGVYSGAGFFYPDSKPGGTHLSGGLWESTLRLAEGTSGFADLLGRARLVGRVTAVRDDQGVWRLQRQIQQRIRERLAGLW